MPWRGHQVASPTIATPLVPKLVVTPKVSGAKSANFRSFARKLENVCSAISGNNPRSGVCPLLFHPQSVTFFTVFGVLGTFFGFWGKIVPTVTKKLMTPPPPPLVPKLVVTPKVSGAKFANFQIFAQKLEKVCSSIS